MLQPVQSLIGDLESALASRSSERRLELLNRVTGLFMTQAGTSTAAEIEVFDEVLLRLADGIEMRARAELATSLAKLSDVPARLTERLARDESILVAGPILEHVERLDQATLVDCAATRGQPHLMAISRRRDLAEPITDLLVTRGDRETVRSVAGNHGARFSDAGFQILVTHAGDDDFLAETVGLRHDLPADSRRRLVAQASDLVRRRLADRDPTRAHDIARIISGIAADVAPARDFDTAERALAAMVAASRLDETVVAKFARTGRATETIAALAAITDLPCAVVEEAFDGAHADPMLILGKAASLSWPTMLAVLTLRNNGQALAPPTAEAHRTSFASLRKATADRVVRFYKVRRSAAGSGRAE